MCNIMREPRCLTNIVFVVLPFMGALVYAAGGVVTDPTGIATWSGSRLLSDRDR